MSCLIVYLFSDVGWLVWLKYLSWFQYAFSALTINQWSDITNITCPLPASEESVLQSTLPSMFDNENFTVATVFGSENYTLPVAPGFIIPCITTGEQVLKQLNFDPVS